MNYDAISGTLPSTQSLQQHHLQRDEFLVPEISPSLEQSAVSLVSCVAILTILCVFGLVCLVALSLKYRHVTQRHVATTGDGWMSVTLVFGGVLCYASILPLGARVIYILHYGTDDTKSLGTQEAQLQLGAWLLSLGFSLLLGAQSVLSWRRWKIQNSHFFIRLEYLSAIILLIVLVDMAQLTLWQTTDPFHCTSERKTPGIITCKVHYLPLWLLSNFLHKGVLLFTTIVYSWRMQLQSTSRTIMRSISGCALINASLSCVSVCLLAPLVCIASEWPALQHLSLSILIVATTTASVSLHFIPGLLNALDERRQDQIVRVRATPSSQQQAPHHASNRNSRLLLDAQIKSSMLNMHHQSNKQLNNQVSNNHKTKALVRLGGLINNQINPDLARSRELIQHHKSCSYLEQNSSVEIGRQNHDTRAEPARFSHISTSTAPTSSHYHQQHRQSRRSSRKSQSPIIQPGPKQHQLNHISMSNQTRVRKSFSMNDMKSFIMHERMVEQQHLLQHQHHQQREVELVPITEPLRQALKSAKLLKSGQITHSVTTPTLSPNSSLTKSLTNDDNIEEEESSIKNVADTLNNTLESNQLFETWL